MLYYDFIYVDICHGIGSIANGVLRDLDLHFRGQTFSRCAFVIKKKCADSGRLRQSCTDSRCTVVEQLLFVIAVGDKDKTCKSERRVFGFERTAWRSGRRALYECRNARRHTIDGFESRASQLHYITSQLTSGDNTTTSLSSRRRSKASPFASQAAHRRRPEACQQPRFARQPSAQRSAAYKIPNSNRIHLA